MTHDWNAIRREYEQGVSQAQLSKRYAISQPAISRKAKREQWVKSPVISSVISPPSMPIPSISIDALADLGIQGLAVHLKNPLGLKDHMLLSQSLTQYVKAKILAPQGGDQETGLFIDIGKLPAWKRMELRRLLASDGPQGEVM
jgi:DNA-binding transcriptional regulator LsrR (DeoR family)